MKEKGFSGLWEFSSLIGAISDTGTETDSSSTSEQVEMSFLRNFFLFLEYKGAARYFFKFPYI